MIQDGGEQPTFSGEGGGLEVEFNHVVNDSINCAYVMTPW